MTNKIVKNMSDIIVAPEPVEEEELTSMKAIPFADISALGGALSPFVDMFQSFTTDSGGMATNLYQVVLPEGADHLATLTNGAGNIGAAFDAENHLVGQAVLNPVEDAAQMAIDPAMAAMAIALVGINMKLNDIKDTQEEVLDFVKADKRGEIRGDINFLMKLLNDYKYNWDSELYRNDGHTKVWDIQ